MKMIRLLVLISIILLVRCKECDRGCGKPPYQNVGACNALTGRCHCQYGWTGPNSEYLVDQPNLIIADVCNKQCTYHPGFRNPECGSLVPLSKKEKPKCSNMCWIAGECMEGRCLCWKRWTGPNAVYIHEGEYKNRILADYCLRPCSYEENNLNPKCGKITDMYLHVTRSPKSSTFPSSVIESSISDMNTERRTSFETIMPSSFSSSYDFISSTMMNSKESMVTMSTEHMSSSSSYFASFESYRTESLISSDMVSTRYLGPSEVISSYGVSSFASYGMSSAAPHEMTSSASYEMSSSASYEMSSSASYEMSSSASYEMTSSASYQMSSSQMSNSYKVTESMSMPTYSTDRHMTTHLMSPGSMSVDAYGAASSVMPSKSFSLGYPSSRDMSLSSEMHPSNYYEAKFTESIQSQSVSLKTYMTSSLLPSESVSSSSSEMISSNGIPSSRFGEAMMPMSMSVLSSLSGSDTMESKIYESLSAGVMSSNMRISSIDFSMSSSYQTMSTEHISSLSSSFGNNMTKSLISSDMVSTRSLGSSQMISSSDASYDRMMVGSMSSPSNLMSDNIATTIQPTASMSTKVSSSSNEIVP